MISHICFYMVELALTAANSCACGWLVFLGLCSHTSKLNHSGGRLFGGLSRIERQRLVLLRPQYQHRPTPSSAHPGCCTLTPSSHVRTRCDFVKPVHLRWCWAFVGCLQWFWYAPLTEQPLFGTCGRRRWESVLQQEKALRRKDENYEEKQGFFLNTENRAENVKDEDVQAGERFQKRKDEKKGRSVEWVQNTTCRRESRRERADEGRSGELKRDTVFRLEGNEGKSCKETAGQTGNYWWMRENKKRLLRNFWRMAGNAEWMSSAWWRTWTEAAVE